MKWHTVAALALVVLLVPACAQLEKVLDACMVGVVGPRAELPLDVRPSGLNSSSRANLWPDPNWPDSQPRLRLSLAASKDN